jgi:hypothetical protein
MTLTIIEKNHWKERITRKLNRAIDDLIQRTDPTFRHKMKEQARIHAIKELGITDQWKRSMDLKAQIESLRETRDLLNIEMERTIKPFDKADVCGYDAENRIKRIIDQRMCEIQETLASETPLGKEIKRLEKEQEEMLDTVWLATSPKEIVNLWNRVVTMLQQPLTDLQRETLKVMEEKSIVNE